MCARRFTYKRFQTIFEICNGRLKIYIAHLFSNKIDVKACTFTTENYNITIEISWKARQKILPRILFSKWVISDSFWRHFLSSRNFTHFASTQFRVSWRLKSKRLLIIYEFLFIVENKLNCLRFFICTLSTLNHPKIANLCRLSVELTRTRVFRDSFSCV